METTKTFYKTVAWDLRKQRAQSNKKIRKRISKMNLLLFYNKISTSTQNRAQGLFEYFLFKIKKLKLKIIG